MPGAPTSSPTRVLFQDTSLSYLGRRTDTALDIFDGLETSQETDTSGSAQGVKRKAPDDKLKADGDNRYVTYLTLSLIERKRPRMIWTRNSASARQ